MLEETTKKVPGPKAGRPHERKNPIGLRMFDSDREIIKEKYKAGKHNGLQLFFDQAVEKELMVIKSENPTNTQD